MRIDGSSDSPNPLAGFMEIATVLADPGKLAAEYDKLEKAKAAAQAVVDLAGPAQSILDLRDAAAQDRYAAQQEFDGAKTAAADLISQAREQAVQLVGGAREHAEQLTADAQALLEQASAANAEADAATREVALIRRQLVDRAAAAQAELNSQLDVARAAEQAAAEKQAVLDEKLALMDALAQHIVSTVALTE